MAGGGGGFRPESILTAAKNNDVEALRNLVESGVPVEFCNQVRRRRHKLPSPTSRRCSLRPPLPPPVSYYLQIGQTGLHVAALW